MKIEKQLAKAESKILKKIIAKKESQIEKMKSIATELRALKRKLKACEKRLGADNSVCPPPPHETGSDNPHN